jgi:hypothetical protein
MPRGRRTVRPALEEGSTMSISNQRAYGGRFRPKRPKGDGGPPRIAIKLSRRAKVRTERAPAALQTFLERVAPGAGKVASIQPLITSQKPEAVEELVARATRVDPDYEPVDFGAWLQIELESTPGHEPPAGQFDAADPDDVDELIRRLHGLPEIDSAYALRAGPPPVNALDDPRAINQGYLNAAPQGIDARYAWGFAGGDGAGIGFVDMEQGWNLSHEDLAAAGITLISGSNTAYFSHGTSVLGEVLQVDNTVGGVGIAPAGVGRVISQHQPGGYNTAGAIIDAVAHMAFGDVLLLEAQEYDPVGGQYFWPVEVADGNYDAIRLATALGIVVVEAGCNGGYDLDAYVNLGGQAIFNRGAAGFRDSGAIMVGAGDATDPHARLSFSNHGSRVDVYAWGESVDTTTTNATGTDNTAYTGGFNGTSSASPIISGAAMILQGIAEASLGYRFSPRELRRLIVIGGTPSQTPATDRIGVMPNLRAIIDGTQLGLAADHYLRDYVGDSGDPTGGGVSLSPDIIVRQAPVADPQGSFGEGSGTENNAMLSEPVLAAHDHSVYVRLQNRGGSADANVAVDVYWSPPSTLVTPNLWNAIGTVTVPSVPVGDVLTVSDELHWPAAAVPGAGHYCFVAVSGSGSDPAPSPTAFSTWNNWLTYVTNNNNVAWRNFDVVPGPPEQGMHAFPFVIPGAFDKARVFELQAFGNLPRGSKVELRLPVALARQLKIPLAGIDRQEGHVAIPLNPFGRRQIGHGAIEAKSVNECELVVSVPEETYKTRGRFEFAVRQLYREREVGRLTWRFGTHGRKDAC